jgi:ABC-type transport system involved in multi-copper enzyme maturation permease subunit
VILLNPLLTKELRTIARSGKMYAIGVILIIALSALTFGLIWEASTTERTLDPEYGRGMFLSFVAVLTLAICLIFPAFTAGAISSERERRTFELLRVTLLKPHQYLVGKMGPVLIYILIILSASLPVAILMLPLGGISTAELIYCYMVTFIPAMAFSLIGLMWSSVFRNTRTSTGVTYAFAGFFIFGTGIVPMILKEAFRAKLNRTLLDLCVSLNPFYAAASILGRTKGIQIAGLSPQSITIAGYLVISLITACIAMLRFKRMRG